MNSSPKDYTKLIELASSYEACRSKVEAPWATVSAEQQAAHDRVVQELVSAAKESDVRVFQFRDSIFVISSQDGVMSVPLNSMLRLGE
jgi:hypothetical protein